MVLGTTRPINIEDEMRSSYLDYAMSVIISRALPDVRDGLKPVQRRILYAMNDIGNTHNNPHKKSARIVGEVLGKYHPHGDSSVYDAMVRMAQDFSMRYPLVDGQGNFGSIDNDPPAAMRYTEARLAAIANEMLVDLEKNTVDFVPNFDDSLTEPSVLPANLPNLLVNGSSGIAVGMATNIPPHNLSELCAAIAYLIDNPEASVDDLMEFVKGPDFPTAGIILGQDGVKEAYATGHGRIVMQAKVQIGEISGSGRRQIIVTELPYQVNKANLVEKIATLVKDKRITGIAEVRDESDRQGLRVVVDLRRDAQPQKVLNALFKYTPMQTSFSVNMLALVEGQPRVLNLRQALQLYINFRQEVITRRTRFDLKVAKDRAHILEGFKIALDQIDAVIATIRESETAEAARRNLMSRFEFSQIQAQAILDMQLRRLANLERQKILDEYAELLKTIAYLEDLLANPRRILELVKEDAGKLSAKHGDERRTEISNKEVRDYNEEDLIPHQRMLVTISERGFIKRTASKNYKTQHRGGRGIKGMPTREEDTVRILEVADTHDHLFFFTNRGKVFRVKCHELPNDASRTSKGLAVVNLFPIGEGERVTAMVAAPQLRPESFLLMATAKGEIKKTSADKFAAVRSNGIIAMDLEPADELVSAHLAGNDEDTILVTAKGQAIRFKVEELRASSRTSGGVRGVKLASGDKVVGMVIPQPDTYLLTITANGYGKITRMEQYPRHHRGGMGVRTFRLSESRDEVAGAMRVSLEQELMIISRNGIVIRTPVREGEQGISIQGRSTQGVRIMKLDNGDAVVALAAFSLSNETNVAEEKSPKASDAKKAAVAETVVEETEVEEPEESDEPVEETEEPETEPEE